MALRRPTVRSRSAPRNHLGFIFLKGGLKRFGLESFQGEEANLPPSSTVSTRRWRAPAIASGFA